MSINGLFYCQSFFTIYTDITFCMFVLYFWWKVVSGEDANKLWTSNNKSQKMKFQVCNMLLQNEP